MDERDALLQRALEALYWWNSEHGCCEGATDETEKAIHAHLISAGVSVETYAEKTAREHQTFVEESEALQARMAAGYG